jgi:peroxiredoxin Q/BCP
MAKLRVGDSAPDFDLEGTGSRRYSLADFRSNGVILAFYPGDFTPVCTKQFCSYRDRADDMSALDAVVVGISHQDVESHEAFAAHHALTVPLLADVDREVAKAYGASAPVLGTRRAAFVIDEDGIIRHRVVHTLGLDFQSADDLAEALDSLRSRA